MKVGVVFAILMLNVLNIEASGPKYKVERQLFAPNGKALASVGTVYGGQYAARDSGGKSWYYDGSSLRDVGTEQGMFDAWIAPSGGSVNLAGWRRRSSDQNYQHGYYYQNKLNLLPVSPTSGRYPSESLTGGGDWVGGYVYNPGNSDVSIELAYAHNPVTGQTVEFNLGRYSRMVTANARNTILFQGGYWASTGNFYGMGIKRFKDGILSNVAAGAAYAMNDHDDILMSNNAGGQFYIAYGDGTFSSALGGSMERPFNNAYGNSISNSGRVLVGESGAHWFADKDGWYPLRDAIEGLPPLYITQVAMDPVTDQLYISGAGSGSNDTITFLVNPVPEPGTLAALGLGVATLARRRRPKA